VKLICSTIFIFCCGHFLLAQNVTEYKWESNDGKTVAQISIKPAVENASNKTILYFITMQDSASENLIDTSCNSIFNALPASCTPIKIALYQKLDSQEIYDFIGLSKLLIKEILPFVHKKSTWLKEANVIMAGVDLGAEVALISALSFPDKFNKTALFFNNTFAIFSYRGEFDKLAPSIKGKLFMYVKHANEELNITDEMANSLALKSSIMLYKIDVDAEYDISFEDGYKWLMADGNNYIIETE
jgi:hypothetical protein